MLTGEWQHASQRIVLRGVEGLAALALGALVAPLPDGRGSELEVGCGNSAPKKATRACLLHQERALYGAGLSFVRLHRAAAISRLTPGT